MFQEGSLFQMTNLRHLAIGTYERIKGLDIPKLMDFNHVLKHLEIDVIYRNLLLMTKYSSISSTHQTVCRRWKLELLIIN